MNMPEGTKNRSKIEKIRQILHEQLQRLAILPQSQLLGGIKFSSTVASIKLNTIHFKPYRMDEKDKMV